MAIRRLFLLFVFALSRVIYYRAGVHFDSRPLQSFFQLFDPVLLQHHLIETLFYAHSQPPGFNLIVGCVLKLFPDHFGAACHVLYLALGITIMLALFQLMHAMGVSANLAVAATAVFIISPGVVLFENLLLYEYPIFALLCLAALCYLRLFERPRAWVAFLLFSLIAALVFIRSLFQLPYFVVVIAVVVYCFPQYRKKLALAAALPLLLVLAMYFKNWALYRQFTSSTWMGFALYTVTIHQLTPEELDRFIAEGNLSPVERLPAMEPVSTYAGYIAPERPTHIPVLDQIFDVSGRANFNNIGYLQLHQLYLRDARYVLLHYPQAYARSLVMACFTYFLPTGDFPFFGENRMRIRAFDRWFNVFAFGQFKEAGSRSDLRALRSKGASVFSLAAYTGVFLLIGLPALFVFGCWKLWDDARRSSWKTPRNALLAFMLFHIAMVTVVVNLLSSFENNRYRLPIDGFFLILFAVVIQSAIAQVSGSRAAAQDHSAGVAASQCGGDLRSYVSGC